MTSNRIVALISDFGLNDAYAGQMAAAVVAHTPRPHVVSLTHDIPPHDIAFGAIVTAACIERLPVGSIVVAVVDPGVGGERRGLIVRASSRWLVGPDNGILMAAPDISGVWCLDRPEYWTRPAHPTIHGRDVFAPIAGHLARYIRPDTLGARIEDPVRAPAILARETSDGVDGEVIHIDHFGNLITNIPPAAVAGVTRGMIQFGSEPIGKLQSAYGHGDDLIALTSSLGLVEIAMPSGNAAVRLSASRGDRVSVRSA